MLQPTLPPSAPHPLPPVVHQYEDGLAQAPAPGWLEQMEAWKLTGLGWACALAVAATIVMVARLTW